MKNIMKNVGLFKNHMLKVEEGFLRSSLEIFTYDKLKERNIEFEIDKKYPCNNPGSWRYDFYLPKYEIYIEISPSYKLNASVKEKIDKKTRTFWIFSGKK